jgi:hypothetical protein
MNWQEEVKKMTNEVSKHGWKRFFNSISKNYLEWQTRVEILKNDIGAQLLSDGLPLIGFTFEEKAEDRQSSIKIMLGEGSETRQTHTISNPQKVFFKESEKIPGGTIEIEDESGAKTLVRLVQPISVLVAYEGSSIAVRA